MKMPKQQLADILREAKALIADPDKHISATHPDYEHLAKLGGLLPVRQGDRYCAHGAVYHLSREGLVEETMFLTNFCRILFGVGIGELNDTMGYDAVHILFDEAIEGLEAEGHDK